MRRELTLIAALIILASTITWPADAATVECTKMNDGRILFDGPSYSQNARDAGFADINNPPTYRLRKFTATASKDEFGDIEGVCEIEFEPYPADSRK